MLQKKIVFVKSLPGEVILPNISTNDDTGILIINMHDGTERQILKGLKFTLGEWNRDKKKILLFNDYYISGFVTSSDYSVFEYDIEKSVMRPILKEVHYTSRHEINYERIRYIPGKNAISYIFADGYKLHDYRNYLHIYDLDRKKDEKLFRTSSYYSWDSNGTSIYYNPMKAYAVDNHIFEYNVMTKETKELFTGYTPECSHNGEYIAYTKYNGDLVVREMKNGKEWPIMIEGYNYLFSPDDKYIMLSKDWNELPIEKAKQVLYYEFKTGKSGIFIYDRSGKVNWYDWN